MQHSSLFGTFESCEENQELSIWSQVLEMDQYITKLIKRVLLVSISGSKVDTWLSEFVNMPLESEPLSKVVNLHYASAINILKS